MRSLTHAASVPRMLILAALVVLGAGSLLLPSASVVVMSDLVPVTTRVRVDARQLTAETLESTTTVHATGHIAPAPGRGFVRFRVPTPTGFEFLSDLPSPPEFTIPPGTAVYACRKAESIQGECSGAVSFETTEPALMSRDNEQCFLFACSIVSNRVRVVAVRNGPSGNVKADWIRDTDVAAPNGIEVYVSTGWPTRGGTFEREPVLTREDVARGLRRVREEMRQQIVADLESQAEERGLAVTMIQLHTSARRGNHAQLGRELEIAAVHDTMSGKAWGYSDEDLVALASSALAERVPTGHHFLEDTINEDAVRREEGEQFRQQIVMRVTGLAAPIAEAAVVEAASGASPADLERVVASAPGVTGVQVDQWPMDLPVLPLFEFRIDVRFRDIS